jgi:hypothetical protein
MSTRRRSRASSGSRPARSTCTTRSSTRSTRRETEARFRLKPAGKGHRLLAGRTVKMTSEGGEYRVTVPGRSYSIYRLER